VPNASDPLHHSHNKERITMKFSLIIGIIAGLIVPACSKAQGTTYFSNLGNPSTSSIAVGSDSWNGASFVTGTNANGYTLRSVQLLMGNAIGGQAIHISVNS